MFRKVYAKPIEWLLKVQKNRKNYHLNLGWICRSTLFITSYFFLLKRTVCDASVELLLLLSSIIHLFFIEVKGTGSNFFPFKFKLYGFLFIITVLKYLLNLGLLFLGESWSYLGDMVKDLRCWRCSLLVDRGGSVYYMVLRGATSIERGMKEICFCGWGSLRVEKRGRCWFCG